MLIITQKKIVLKIYIVTDLKCFDKQCLLLLSFIFTLYFYSKNLLNKFLSITLNFTNGNNDDRYLGIDFKQPILL